METQEYISETFKTVDNQLMSTYSIRSSDTDSTGLWQPGSLHTLGADGQI